MNCWSGRIMRSWKQWKNHAFRVPTLVGFSRDKHPTKVGTLNTRNMEVKRNRIVIALVALWVVFTVTLAGWWLIFGLRQLDLINQSKLEGAAQLQRHYQMLMWEGGILIASLIGGGLALFYYARREQKRHAQVEEFFAAFTHDA